MERTEDSEERLVERFAWLPVHYTGAPWFAFDSWCHLSWYVAEQVFEPDYGGVSTGNWLTVARRAASEPETAP